MYPEVALLAFSYRSCYSRCAWFQQLGEELNYQMPFCSLVCHIILKSPHLAESMLSLLVLISVQWVFWIYLSIKLWQAYYIVYKIIFTTLPGGKRWPIQSIDSLGPGNKSCSRRTACIWNERWGKTLGWPDGPTWICTNLLCAMRIISQYIDMAI